MSTTSDYDYKKLGLMVGIEIHQQLATKTKLFCRCENKLRGQDPPEYLLTRNFRPVLGEEGKFDPAMLVEFKKKNQVIYEGFMDCSCTYETDETPPFHCNPHAIDIALEIGLLLNLMYVEKIMWTEAFLRDSSAQESLELMVAFQFHPKKRSE